MRPEAGFVGLTGMQRKFDVAVLGATGAVGETMLSILEERSFPVGSLYALASQRSAGKRLRFRDAEIVVQAVDAFDFSRVRIGLFSAGAEVSRVYAPKAVASGCVVIDNTSQFRYQKDIPLIVPEVNPHAIPSVPAGAIISNPNCSTIQMLLVLKPLHDAVGIARVNVCTYQAVSGTGKQAVEELRMQSRRLLDGDPIEARVYPRQIAFNVLPCIDQFQSNAYTREEMKMVWETRKILEDDTIQVNPTAVRVPVLYGHSEALHVETRQRIAAADARAVLEQAPGVMVLDDCESGLYPDAATTAAFSDPVYVGRIREDISHPKGLNMWVVADNVRKGAALNSVQIAEVLVKKHL